MYLVRLFGMAVALCVCTSIALAQVSRPDTVEETLSLLQRALIANDRVTNAKIDTADNSVKFTFDDDLEATSFPDNLHRQLQLAKSDTERQEALDFFIASALDAIEPRPLDIQSVLPAIRYETLGMSDSTTSELVSVPFVADMRIFFVQDMPTSMSFLSHEDLKELGLTKAQLRSHAMENWQAKGWQPKIDGDGIYILVLDGVYEASFLLDTALWSHIDTQLGQIIMAAPARDLVVFADNEQEGAEQALRDIIAKYAPTASHPLSEKLLAWKNDAWVSLD